MSRAVSEKNLSATDCVTTTSDDAPLSPPASAQHFDPELIEIIDRWPTLPDATKQALIAIVRGDKS